MMNSSEDLESVRKVDAEDAKTSDQPEFSVSGEEKVSLNLNSDSVCGSEGEEISRVSMHVDENAGISGDVSLVIDFRGSEEEARVSQGVDEANEFRICEIKNEDETSKTNNGFSELEGSEKKLELVSDEKGEIEVVSGAVDNNNDAWSVKFDKKQHHKKGNVEDYDSMLSMFDQYAANGKSGYVGFGYEIGDMVWGRVKSHPWWPGHIYSEAFASSSVRRTKREGHVLVAFFGDNSYGWFDPAELIPFEPNYAEKSKQTTSKTFVKAVEEAVDEVNRRSSMALVCRCRNPSNFKPTNVEGYFTVDVAPYEAGTYSASQLKKARDNFQPGAMLNFVKQLASRPMEMIDEIGNITFIQNKATVFAFRKAVFEEYDETYAQAFGAQPVRPGPRKAPAGPSKAPLSGRQVFAETLGRKKSSGKQHKSKDQVEKDQYLFKRRDEAVESKTQKISPSSQSDVSTLPAKSAHDFGSSPASKPSVSSVAEDIEQSVIESHHSMVIDTKPLGEGSKTHPGSGLKKAKLHKRRHGEMNSESSSSMAKMKKRKKDSGRQSFDHTKTPTVDGKGGTLPGKDAEGSGERSDVSRENTHENHQANNDAGITPSPPDSVGTKTVDGNIGFQLELPQLLDDLRALALNPFHGAERRCQAIIRDVFMRFRSVVYQKSLPSMAPGENENREARPPSSDHPPIENFKDWPSAKPPKPPNRQADPTKGGRKRGPSDRQEEMAVKKKKKMNDLKTWAAEKRAGQNTLEGQGDDGKESSGKTMGRMPERKNVQRTPEVQRGDVREMAGKPTALAPSSKVSGSEFPKKRQLPARAANPTMLVMKFPPGAALPSPAELKAKFARFGPLDHSGTRIFWKSSTIRLVYQHKIDAQAALRFATSSTNLFGNTNVRCHLREIEVETPETESAKVQKEDSYSGPSQSRDTPVLLPRMTSNSVPQPLQHQVQLKSILKRASGEDGGTTNPGGGNGNGRGRVKFMLSGEGSSKTNGDDGSASSHGLNYNTEKIHMVVPPVSSSILLPPPPTPSPQFPPTATNNSQHTDILSRNVQNFSNHPSSAAALPNSGPTNIDITHQMLSLLTRCKDVVNNLTGALGYVPYHPL